MHKRCDESSERQPERLDGIPAEVVGAASGLGKEGLSDAFRILSGDGTSGK